MIRVLFVTGSFPPDVCGVGDYTAHLASALARTGAAEVHVLTAGPGKASRNAPGVEDRPGTKAPSAVAVHREIGAYSIAGLLSALRRVARRVAPDIVHVQYPTLRFRRRLGPRLLPWLIRATIPGARVAVTLHEPASNFASLLYNGLPMLGAHGLVFVESHHLLAQWGAVGQWVAARCVVEVIPISSNLPHVTLSSDEVARIRQGLGVPPGRPLLGHFGFVKAPKGVHLLPAVLRKIPGAHLLLIGEPGEDATYLSVVKRALSEGDLKERVHWLGRLTALEAARHLAACDVAVFPLVDGCSERSGSVAAAASLGVFTVTTHPTWRGVSFEESNTRLPGVFYVAPKDLDGMAEAVRGHLSRAFRNGAARLGQARDWQTIARRHLHLYERLLGSRR